MFLYRLIAAALIGAGLYIVLSNLLHPYSLRAAKALERLTGRKITLKDRLIMPLARKIAPMIHLPPYRRQELLDNLTTADSSLTPEQFTAQNLVVSGVIILCGVLLFRASYLFTVALTIYGLYVYHHRKSGLTAAAAQRITQRKAELPRFASYLVQAVQENHDLFAILSDYRPTAGPELGSKLDTLLIAMRTGNVEQALQQFAVSMGIPIVSDLVMGLIAASHGEDVRDYLLSLSARFDQMEDTAQNEEIERRQALFTVPNYLLLFCMIAVMMTALGVYAYQMYTTM